MRRILGTTVWCALAKRRLRDELGEGGVDRGGGGRRMWWRPALRLVPHFVGDMFLFVAGQE